MMSYGRDTWTVRLAGRLLLCSMLLPDRLDEPDAGRDASNAVWKRLAVGELLESLNMKRITDSRKSQSGLAWALLLSGRTSVCQPMRWEQRLLLMCLEQQVLWRCQ